MEYLRIGKYANTHGLKGEIRILSELNDNGSVFNVGNTIYIGKNKIPFVITSYRRHQKYDMVMLETIDSIEKASQYKGATVFINTDDLSDDLFENLLDYEVHNNGVSIGKVVEILKGVKYDFIVVSDKRIIIPYIDNFIISVDKENKIIKTDYMI